MLGVIIPLCKLLGWEREMLDEVQFYIISCTLIYAGIPVKNNLITVFLPVFPLSSGRNIEPLSMERKLEKEFNCQNFKNFRKLCWFCEIKCPIKKISKNGSYHLFAENIIYETLFILSKEYEYINTVLWSS